MYVIPIPQCLHTLNMLAPVCIFSAGLFKVKLVVQESRPLERRRGEPPEITTHDSAAISFYGGHLAYVHLKTLAKSGNKSGLNMFLIQPT